MLPGVAHGQRAPAAPADSVVVLAPDRVFLGTGESSHPAWVVVVRGDRIEAVGPRDRVTVPADARRIDLPGTTLMPGMIEGHTHLFLHPYDETPWNDQVLEESLSLRTVRAVNHARATLRAGSTTARDLGTEGAAFAHYGRTVKFHRGNATLPHEGGRPS